MKKILLCIVLCNLTVLCFSQYKFKLQVGGAATTSNVTSVSFLFTGEQRFDINKGIKLGIGLNQLYYQLPLTRVEDFYEEFYEGQPFQELTLDSIHSFDINLYGAVIPIGYSFYLSPRFYLDYTMEINFITGADFNLLDKNEDDLSDYYPLQKGFFNKSYISHSLAAYRVYWRRLECGIGTQFTYKKSIIKQGTMNFEEDFNKAFSKYVGFFFSMRYYFFQIKATDI